MLVMIQMGCCKYNENPKCWFASVEIKLLLFCCFCSYFKWRIKRDSFFSVKLLLKCYKFKCIFCTDSDRTHHMRANFELLPPRSETLYEVQINEQRPQRICNQNFVVFFSSNFSRCQRTSIIVSVSR